MGSRILRRAMRTPRGRRPHHALPQNVHLMAKGKRTVTLCGHGAAGFGFIRLNDEGIAYLARFLRDGGRLCTVCKRKFDHEGWSAS